MSLNREESVIFLYEKKSHFDEDVFILDNYVIENKIKRQENVIFLEEILSTSDEETTVKVCQNVMELEAIRMHSLCLEPVSKSIFYNLFGEESFYHEKVILAFI
jgi:hypothetical protein